MANPLKKSDRNREEPKLGEPKLVKSDELPEPAVVQEFQGESVADSLIRARQQVGQDLRSIAEVLCIRHSYLDAIERGQYENLPGATYAVGFVRTYAEYLGLDGDKVVERFKNEVEGLDSQTKLHFPTPAPEGKMPGGAVFLVAALLFAGAYGVWFYLSNNGEGLGDLVAPVPDRLQAMVDGDSPSVASDVTTAPAAASAPITSGPATPAETAPAAEPSAGAETATTGTATRPETAVDAAPESAAADEAPAAPAAPEPDVPAITQSAEAPQVSGTVPGGDGASQAEAPAAANGAPATAADTTTAGTTMSETEAASRPAAESPAPAGDLPASDSSVASAPAENDQLAIPAAPDSSDQAPAFLANHEPKVYGEENTDARIVLKANQDAWVQVRDRQGTLLLTRVLRVGDTYLVPNQQDLTLLTGNAGGLEITVDGRALAPLGPVGAVRRNIPLDPQALVGGTAN